MKKSFIKKIALGLLLFSGAESAGAAAQAQGAALQIGALNGDRVHDHWVRVAKKAALVKMVALGTANPKKIRELLCRMEPFDFDRVFEYDFANVTLLELACSSLNSDIVQVLLESGAQATFLNRAYFFMLPFAQVSPCNYSLCDRNTVLLKKNERNLKRIIELLDSWGANIETVDQRGQNLLMAALLHAPLTVLDDLVERGVSVNCQDRWGNTPLMHAVCSYRLVVVKKFLALNADTSLQDYRGMTAFMLAKERNQKVMMAHLETAATPYLCFIIKDDDYFTCLTRYMDNPLKKSEFQKNTVLGKCIKMALNDGAGELIRQTCIIS